MDTTEFVKLQLQQAVDTYRAQLSLEIQIWTVLVLGNASIFGYAVAQKLAGVIWVGIIFPITMRAVGSVVRRTTIPILATAVEIEEKYCEPTIRGLVSTFIATSVSPVLLQQLRLAANAEASERMKILTAAQDMPHIIGRNSGTRAALLYIAWGQAVLPFVLWKFAHWRLFVP